MSIVTANIHTPTRRKFLIGTLLPRLGIFSLSLYIRNTYLLEFTRFNFETSAHFLNKNRGWYTNC